MKLAIVFLALGLASANPIGKIVTLLNGMKSKIANEGAESSTTHKEYLNWSAREVQATEHSIENNKDAVERADACIADTAAQVQEHQSQISTLTSSTAKNEKEVAEAQELRKQQNADFRAGEKDLVDTIDALIRAASVIRRGGGASLAQMKTSLTQLAGTLSIIMDAAAINSFDKAKLQGFVQKAQGDDDDDDGFQQPTAAAYSGHSNSIVDLLAELKVKAETELSDARKEEMERKHAFDMLFQSMTDSINVNARDLKVNKGGLNEQQEVNAKCTGELSDQKAQLAANEKYLADLKTQAGDEASEFESSTKSRGEEQAAVQKAIDILSGEDFQKATSRRMQLVQLKARQDPRTKVAELLRAASRQFHSVGLAQLAIRVSEDPFGKVRGLIEQMIARLQHKAAEETDRKAYCDKENRESKAKRDDQSGKLDNFSARLEKAEADKNTLKEDVAALTGEVADLDSSLSERTKLRGEENKAFLAAAEDHRVGLEGLNQALQVLREYYASAQSHAAKQDSSTGVISMLEVAEADMTRMQAEAQMGEETAARDFAKFKQDAEVMRASKTTANKAKQQELARLGGAISDLKSDVEGTNAELTSTMNYIEKLKQTCVHKPQTFADRAAAMQKEIESLHEALRILNEESAESFLQRRA